MSDMPKSLKAKEWEKECQEAFQWTRKRGIATASRYGVVATMIEGKWIPIPSLPDFEGVVNEDGKRGRQFIFDCKVCSGPSFPIGKLREERKRQLNHMLERAEFGAICFFAVWFNEWQTQSNYYPPSSWAFPVFKQHPLWEQFAAGFGSTITRLACEEYAVPIQWQAPSGGHKVRPNLLGAVHAVAERVENARAATSSEGEWKDQLW